MEQRKPCIAVTNNNIVVVKDRPKPEPKPTPTLCARCEFRALAYETEHGPRYECADFAHSYACCYMYQPTAILELARSKTEYKLWGKVRPMAGPWIIGARLVATGLAPTRIQMRDAKGGKGIVLYRKLLPNSLTERENISRKRAKRGK